MKYEFDDILYKTKQILPGEKVINIMFFLTDSGWFAPFPYEKEAIKYAWNYFPYKKVLTVSVNTVMKEYH